MNSRRNHAQASAEWSVATVNVCFNLVTGAGFEPPNQTSDPRPENDGQLAAYHEHY